MDRYKEDLNHGEPWMEPDPEGMWVMYDDAMAAIEAEREACAAREPSAAGMILRMIRDELCLKDGENVLAAIAGLRKIDR